MTLPSDARLTPEAFARARTFLLERGRPLEAARFRHAFEGGSAADVLDALRTYRNPDGGFGQALEPDVRAPESSVLATATALEVLHDLNVSASDELLAGAVEWLRDHLHVTLGGSVWPFLPPEAGAHPHAPWWSQAGPDTLALAFGGFRVNPRAGIVARLWRWPELLPGGLLALLTVETRDAIPPGSSRGTSTGTGSRPSSRRLPRCPRTTASLCWSTCVTCCRTGWPPRPKPSRDTGSTPCMWPRSPPLPSPLCWKTPSRRRSGTSGVWAKVAATWCPFTSPASSPARIASRVSTVSSASSPS